MRGSGLNAFLIYGFAALAEIVGCYTFWVWLRQGQSGLWLIPGIACLAVFALLLTRIDVAFAGPAYAAYGGIYIVASLLWLVEARQPDRWDLLGGTVCLAGAAIIVLAPRST
ncbi:MAG: YnfA family protein [Hyphomicrobiaceae bacterium]